MMVMRARTPAGAYQPTHPPHDEGPAPGQFPERGQLVYGYGAGQLVHAGSLVHASCLSRFA
jgi:hypothetical protein